MTIEWVTKLFFFTVLVSLLPVGVGVRYLGRANATQRWLTALVVFAAATEVTSMLVSQWLRQPTIVILHVFSVVEFLLLLRIYQLNGVISRDWTWPALLLIPALGLASALQWDAVAEYRHNATLRSTECVVLTGLALRYFFTSSQAVTKLVKYQPAQLGSSPMFWVNTAVLLYFPAALFIFLFSQWYATPGDPYGLMAYAVQAILSIVKSILFTIALWKRPPRR